jgi:hypothetical protein
MKPPSGTKSSSAIWILLAAIGLFYISTIRPGLDWDGDNSMYIHHAKNIVEGRSYDDTGYIVNPASPGIGPRTYPPVFPLLLTPVYWAAGLNYDLMKMVTIIFFILSLYSIYLNFKGELPTIYNFLIICLIGFNYYLWDFKDRIMSDLPFLFFTYTSMYLASRCLSINTKQWNSYFVAFLAGLFLYLSYGTRSIGIAILPAIVLSEIINTKRITAKTITIVLTFFALAFVQNLFFHAEGSEGSYLDRFFFDTANIYHNSIIYLRDFFEYFKNGYSNALNKIIFITFSIFSFLGFVIRARRFKLHEIYFTIYLTIILIWPGNQGKRLLIPLLPLYIFYFFFFFHTIEKSTLKSKRWEKAGYVVVAAIISSIFMSYGLLYHKNGMKPIKYGIHKDQSVELFNYIKNNTTKNDVIIFRKPRALALMTGRSSACYHTAENDSDLWNFFQNIGATYIVEDHFNSNFTRSFNNFIARNKKKLTLVFTNNDFNIYKIFNNGTDVSG